MYYAYILKSLKDGTFYIGPTKDLDDRVKQHNAGKVRSTKSRQSWMLHYHEYFNTKMKALQREYFFKSYQGYLWLKKNGII